MKWFPRVLLSCKGDFYWTAEPWFWFESILIAVFTHPWPSMSSKLITLMGAQKHVNTARIWDKALSDSSETSTYYNGQTRTRQRRNPPRPPSSQAKPIHIPIKNIPQITHTCTKKLFNSLVSLHLSKWEVCMCVWWGCEQKLIQTFLSVPAGKFSKNKVKN